MLLTTIAAGLLYLCSFDTQAGVDDLVEDAAPEEVYLELFESSDWLIEHHQFEVAVTISNKLFSVAVQHLSRRPEILSEAVYTLCRAYSGRFWALLAPKP